MEKRPDEEASVLHAAASALENQERAVLAVSGGLDSMVLLHAAASAIGRRKSKVLVATFDHGTGPHATRASKLVQQRSRALGLRCVTGIASSRGTRESEWRDSRWQFLRATAAEFSAPVVTAHTQDDQVETVFIRILRDAGPRGLAGLYADSEVIRPFLQLGRATLEAYARKRHVRYAEDPTNTSRAHLRNRVRHDLLPAIRKVRPTFPASLLSIARTAAEWRQEIDTTIEEMGLNTGHDGSVSVARAALAGYDEESLRVLWPAIAARAGVVMDRRGTLRLTEFTMKGQTGGSIQLSGGFEVRMFRNHLSMGKWDAHRVEMIRSARLSRVMGLHTLEARPT